MELKKVFKREDNYIDLLKIKEIHMVTSAYIGLTHCSAYLEFGCNMNQIKQEVFVSEVNEKKEVGTLFPAHTMTLLPFRYRTGPYITQLMDYTDGKGFSDSDFKAFITDILKAEIEYVKSRRVIIDVSGSNTERQRFFNLLHKECQNNKYENINCKVEFIWD